jgi:hypothetical protein
VKKKLVVATVAATSALATTLALAATHGYKTTRPAQLVATESGVVIDPILSTGDTVGSYQMSGIPDGMGAYRSGGGQGESDDNNNDDDDGSQQGEHNHSGSGDDNSDGSAAITLFMNHELAGTAPPGPGARVSKLTIDARSRSVTSGSYVVTGLEQYARFCSGNLAILNGKAWYQTGEESTSVGTPSPNDTSVGHGGVGIAVDAGSNTVYETPQFGYLPHENIVAAKGLPTATWLTTEDGSPIMGNRSQLYAYMSNDRNWEAAIKDTAALNGSLYVWRADDLAAQSTKDIHRGDTLRGHFVPVTRAENSNAGSLEAAAQAKGAFDFTRLEDLTTTNDPTRFYFNDTGALGAETQKGRVYRLDVNRRNPREAAITLIIDGDLSVTADDANDVVNPDNIAASSRSLVIQEDRNEENRAVVKGGYSRIQVYDIRTETMRTVARVNTTVGLPGDWESSGVIDARGLLGANWWFVVVQAHTSVAPQPGPSLTPNSSVGEDGQLLAIKIPHS